MTRTFTLIDDNPSVNFYHKTILKEFGLGEAVSEFTDPEVALEAIYDMSQNNELTNYILIDINMPKISGWELAESLNRIGVYQKSKVVIVTSSLNPSDMEKAEKMHLKLISKPVDELKFRELTSTDRS